MGWTHRVTIESLIYLLSPETKVPSRIEIEMRVVFVFFQLGGAQFIMGSISALHASCTVYLDGGFIFFHFHPENWGRWTHFDEHIFQMGWFNHQPDIDCWEISPLFPATFAYKICLPIQALLDYEKHINSCKARPLKTQGFLGTKWNGCSSVSICN